MIFYLARPDELPSTDAIDATADWNRRDNLANTLRQRSRHNAVNERAISLPLDSFRCRIVPR
jgi:hypothetical protein